MAQSAITVIERIKNELLLTSDKALCKLLDIKPNTLSTWKKRDTLDFNKVIALCNERQLNLNYIFFGEERETQPTERRRVWRPGDQHTHRAVRNGVPHAIFRS